MELNYLFIMKKTLSSFLLLMLFTTLVTAQLDKEADFYTTNKGDLSIHPINHGTVAFTYLGKTIFVDPFGAADNYEQFSTPDLIFITDVHGDHYSTRTLDVLDISNATFVVPQAVADLMGNRYGENVIVINNGEIKEVMGVSVTAVPMYNLPVADDARHTKGRGNGYIINFDGMNVYLSGDTEDIPEMRALENIDIAFVCMNLPYTMDINQAASAVLEFKPEIVYPYHHRGQDIEAFKQLVAEGDESISVILKNWY